MGQRACASVRVYGIKMTSKSLRRLPSCARGLGLAMAGVLALGACTTERMKIYRASNTGGDYAVLECQDLRVAQLTISQRLAGSVNYTVNSEPTSLLEEQRDRIASIRRERDCPGGSKPIAVTPAQTVAEAPDADLAEGAFLQVATFRFQPNADRLAAELTAQGFTVQEKPITLAGEPYTRVIVGPLTTRSEVARIDKAILRMGFNDAFFLKR